MAVSNTHSEQTPLLREPPSDEITSNGTPNGNAIDELEELSNIQLLGIFSGAFIGCFLVALDSTLIATLSAPISTSFNNMSLFGWLASSFFISTTVSQPLAGKLTDIYGRRSGLITASLVFALGNLLCAVSKHEWMFILGRVVAGFGGGGIGPITTFIMSDLVPLRKRGIWQGAANICFGVGTGIGGPFGGWVNESIGWRWAFVIQIPLTILSIILTAFKINIPLKETSQESERSKIKRVDWLGITILTTSLSAMLLGLNAGGNIMPWTSPFVLVTLSVSVVLLAAFVVTESHYALEPLIPIKLLLHRTVASVCAANWFLAMARFGLLFYIPIYLQVQGYSTSEAGLLLVPESVAIAISSIGAGFIMRWTGRYYVLTLVSQVVALIGVALISTLKMDSPAWPPFFYLFLTGAGFSGTITTTLLALIASVEHTQQAVMTSAAYTFRSSGSVLGVTIASTVFQNVLKPQLRARFEPDLVSRIENDIGGIHNLPTEIKNEASEAYMIALRAVFLTLLGLATLGTLTSCFMREHKLHTRLSRRPSE